VEHHHRTDDVLPGIADRRAGQLDRCLTAAAFLAIIPVIVLFLLIEKNLVAGIVGGAVKG